MISFAAGVLLRVMLSYSIIDSYIPVCNVRVPVKGVAKIARKLGFDHAEAVVSILCFILV